jgi:hypothetical protein
MKKNEGAHSEQSKNEHHGGAVGSGCSDSGVEPCFRSVSACASIDLRLFSYTGFVRTLSSQTNELPPQWKRYQLHAPVHTRLQILLLITEQRIACHADDKVPPAQLPEPRDSVQPG